MRLSELQRVRKCTPLYTEERDGGDPPLPFAVFYRVEDDSILVIAVMHGSRHPRRWKERN